MHSHRTLFLISIFAAAQFLLCGCSPSLRGNPRITVPPTVTAVYTETPASNIRITDTAGIEKNLFDHLGSPILLQFWPDPAALTEAEANAMRAAYDTHGEKIVFLLVCPAPPAPDTLFSEHGLLPLLFFDADGSAAKTYNAAEAPATIFIDADGFIATQSIGPISEEALIFGLNLL